MKNYSILVLAGILAGVVSACQSADDQAVTPTETPAAATTPSPAAPTLQPKGVTEVPKDAVGKDAQPKDNKLAFGTPLVPGGNPLPGLRATSNPETAVVAPSGRNNPFAQQAVDKSDLIEIDISDALKAAQQQARQNPGGAGGGFSGDPSLGFPGGGAGVNPGGRSGFAPGSRGIGAGQPSKATGGNKASTTKPAAKPATNPRLPAVATRPPLPDPTLAKAVEVTGVVQVGSSVQAIVKAPDEPTSRYVTVGQRLSNGQVLVKRIEVNGSEPIVILEQSGVEVARAVGESADVAKDGTPGAAT